MIFDFFFLNDTLITTISLLSFYFISFFFT